MNPQSAAFTPRDLWTDVFRMQQTQAEHAERLMRLERRQDEDARLKSVWGASSPFPGVLSGTPQQVAFQDPPADAFADFDDHSSNLLGSLRLDADDEPRRIGTTSRANSVRFDESANYGHWAHASRSSVDLIPRTGSGLGGHPMIERSSSHKSDGRQSSTGQSVHSMASGRANSLGLETSYSLGHSSASPMETPSLAPGLFVLGTVPAIIRCWLNTDFKHASLLYAAICTGSYASHLDICLIRKLGFEDQIYQSSDGAGRKVKLPVYLPEAVPHHASLQPVTPAPPQIPFLTAEFNVVERSEVSDDSKGIHIFLGSDLLRAHNADILFSTNKLTLFDDDQTKLSIPLCRPEDESSFKCLYASSGSPTHRQSRAHSTDASTSDRETPVQPPIGYRGSVPKQPPPSVSASASDDGSGATSSSSRPSVESRPFSRLLNSQSEPKSDQERPSTPVATAPSTSRAVWTRWRRDTVTDPPNQNNANGGSTSKPSTPSNDWSSLAKSNGPGYQRREQGIKVLKPIKPSARTQSTGSAASGITAPASAPMPSTGHQQQQQSRFFDEGKRRVSTGAGLRENGYGWGSSANANTNGSLAKSRSANPIGGASAFAWLNGGTHVQGK